MRTGMDRVQVSSVNQPVSISSMHAEPGDIVEVDTSGVVIVVSAKAGDVARVSHEIEKTKSQISALNNEGARANPENLTRLLCQLNVRCLKDFPEKWVVRSAPITYVCHHVAAGRKPDKHWNKR